MSFNLLWFLIGVNVRFVLVNFKPLRFCTFHEVNNHPVELFQRVRHHKHVASK